MGLTELYYAGSHGMDIMGPVRHSISDGHQDCIRSTDKQVPSLGNHFLMNEIIYIYIYIYISRLFHIYVVSFVLFSHSFILLIL